MNMKYLIFSLFVQIQITLCYDSRFYNPDLPVFEPFPLNIINPSVSLCNNASPDLMVEFKSREMSYLVFNLSLCGFAIYDITHPEKELQVVKHFEFDFAKGQISSLSITDNQNYLWVGYSNGQVEIYDVQQINFPLIQSQTIGNNDVLRQVIQFKEDNLTFLVSSKNFKIANWENNVLSIVKQVNVTDSNLANIRFVLSKKILVVQGFYSFTFYQQSISDLQQGKLNYICSFSPGSAFATNYFEVIQETVLVILSQLFQYSMVDISDFINSYDGKTCNLAKIKYMDTYPFPMGKQFALTKDQTFIYTQFSKGVFVFDVSQLKFELFQVIRTQGTLGNIMLSSDETYLYHSNRLNAKIFRRTQPNLNLDIPNLLLNQYQQISYTFYKPPQGSADLHIKFEEPKNVLFMTRMDQGSAIFQYYGQDVMDILSLVDNGMPNISIIFQERVTGTNIFYQTRGILGLQIVDYSDLSSPKVLKTNLNLGFKTLRFEKIVFNKAGTLCFISNLTGVVIVSVKDILNPQVISFVNTSQQFENDQTLYRFSISNDDKTLFLHPQTKGITLADISDPYNPYFLFKMYLRNVQHIQQTKDSQYIVCAVAQIGVQIYKINEDRSLSLVSQAKIEGFVNFLSLIYNDNYVIFTTYEIEQIILLSIVDKSNPEIIQIIRLQDNSPISWTTLPKDESFLFATSQKALYQFFIQSQIIMHSSFYKLVPMANSNQKMQYLLQKGQSLQVGDQIQIYLVNIYQNKNVKIQDAFYYHNFLIGNLPSWMEYSPADQVLNIQVSKESLIANENNQFISKTLQQVIFMSYQEIEDNAFTNQKLNINQDDSLKIKQACERAGYIDNSGFVTMYYSPQNKFNLLDNESQQVLQKWNQNSKQQQQIMDFIQFILNQNIINYVVQFHTEPSLFVDFKNSINPISSNQNLIIVTISISNGLFVNKLYNGVLVLINSESNVIQLQGSVQSINSVLQNTIKLSLLDQTVFGTTIADVVVDDQINYKYIQSLHLSEAKFISLQSRVITSSSLQEDLNQYYPQGKLAVETAFNYKIGNTVFQCADSNQLQYKAKIKNGDGMFEEIPQGYWLSFSSNERTLTGTPQTSLYNEQFVIQIEATDGYTVSKDLIIIKISIIPFFIIFSIIIQILGPLLGILGIWKYRMIFYNIVFKHFLIYSKDIVHVSDYYEKKIIITDNLLQIGLKLWQPVQNQLQSKLVQQEISQIYKVNNMIEQINNKYNKNFFKRNETDIPFTEQLKKSMNYNNIINNVNNDQICLDFHNQQDSKLDDNKKFTPIKDLENRKNSKKGLAISSSLTTSARNYGQQENIASNLVRQITYTEKTMQKSQKYILNQKLFLENGQVNFDCIKSLALQKYENNTQEEKVISKPILKQLNNKYSRISTILQYLAAEYFVGCSAVCTQIVNLLKQKALTIYREIDWYKAYVRAEVNEKVLDTNFPTYKLNENFIKLALQEIAEDMLKQQNKHSKTKQNQQLSDEDNKFLKEIIIYLPLIEQYFFAVALGITAKKRKFFEVAKGDCFHCYSFQIRSIKCYEKNAIFHCCVGAQEFLGLNQVEKGLSDNQRLPEWMQIDFQKTEITLKGTPSYKHIGQSRFKIYDLNGYLIKQFDIQVLPSNNQQSEMSQEQELFTKQEKFQTIESPKKAFLLSKFNSNACNIDKINTCNQTLDTPKIIAIPSDQVLECDENASEKNAEKLQNSARNLNEKNFRLLSPKDS